MVTHDPVAASLRRPGRVPRRRPHRRRHRPTRPPTACSTASRASGRLSDHVPTHHQGLCSRTKLRLAHHGLAVVLGVAFMAGTLVLTDTIDQDLRRPLRRRQRRHRRLRPRRVRGRSTPSSRPARPHRRRRSSPTVAACRRRRRRRRLDHRLRPARRPARQGGRRPARARRRSGRTGSTDDALNPYQLVDGHAPAADDEIVIDQHSADDGRLRTSGDDGHGAAPRRRPSRSRSPASPRSVTADWPGRRLRRAVHRRRRPRQLVGDAGQVDGIARWSPPTGVSQEAS